MYVSISARADGELEPRSACELQQSTMTSFDKVTEDGGVLK